MGGKKDLIKIFILKGDEPHIGIKMIMDALHGGLEPPTYRLTADRSNQTEPMEHV